MSYFLRKGLSFLLALLIVANPPVLQQLAAWGQEKAKSAKSEIPAEPSPEDLKRMADEMERAFKALEAAEKEIPRDTFDPKAIVDKVGRDPVKLFEWVRDNTFWVPYQGCLRGHTGVLMDRLGSSLDRALLLAELLRTAGHRIQLARAELSEAQAKELMSKLRPVPEHPLPPTPPASKEELNKLIEKYANQYQLDSGALRKNMEKSSFQATKLAEEVAQRVADQVPALLKAVGKPSQKDATTLRAREVADRLASLRDHWWVQWQDNSAWVDLDALLPDAQPGRNLVAPREIIAPDKKDGKLHLGGKYCHEIVIRIVIEQWKKEGLTEKTVLNHTLRPSELFGQRIALRHIPMNWPRNFNLFEQKEPLQKLKTTVLAENEWMPVLTMGPSVITDLSVTDSGDTHPASLEELATNWGFKQAGGSVGNILKTGTIGKVGVGLRPGDKTKTDGRFTAEWIEYEIRSPGNPPRTIRRQIFDLMGPGWRSTKNLQSQNEEVTRLVRGSHCWGRLRFCLWSVVFRPPSFNV